MTINTSRRGFLKGAGAAVAVLAVGIDPKGALAASTSEAGTAITPFVKIYADGTVAAVIKHFEGGQGTSTGLSTLIAEELNMELSDITFEMAPSDTAVYNNLFFGALQGTGGSTAMANSFMQYRTAGAAARDVLLQAAAKDWDVDVSELTLANGVISGAGKEGQIGEFISTAAQIAVPAEPVLKAPEDWTQIGNTQKRAATAMTRLTAKASMAWISNWITRWLPQSHAFRNTARLLPRSTIVSPRTSRASSWPRRCPTARVWWPMPKTPGPRFKRATRSKLSGI